MAAGHAWHGNADAIASRSHEAGRRSRRSESALPGGQRASANCSARWSHTLLTFALPSPARSQKKDDKKEAEFQCPEAVGNGNFADPSTCRRFYQVSVGAWSMRLACGWRVRQHGRPTALLSQLLSLKKYSPALRPTVRRRLPIPEPLPSQSLLRRHQQTVHVQERGEMRPAAYK